MKLDTQMFVESRTRPNADTHGHDVSAAVRQQHPCIGLGAHLTSHPSTRDTFYNHYTTLVSGTVASGRGFLQWL